MKNWLFTSLSLFLFVVVLSLLWGCRSQNLTNDTTKIQTWNNQTWDRFIIDDIKTQIGDKLLHDPETTYSQKKSLSNLVVLIDYLLSDFQYKKAASYFQELITQTPDRDRAKLLSILFNDLDPSPTHYATLSGFLNQYIASWSISVSDASFYTFTLNLLNDTFKKEEINTLTGSYTDFKNLLWRQFDTYYSYKDVPNYYLDALFAVAYFKHQDFGVAVSLANRAIAKNPRYILPYQIKAYVGVLTRDSERALQALNVLIEIDESKLERYQFLLWLIYYNQNNNQQAQNYLLQMKSPVLRIEWLRYLIDSEKRSLRSSSTWSITINNTHDKTLQRYFEELFDPINHTQLRSIDFQTLFDWYLYDRIDIAQWWALSAKELYAIHPDLLNNALSVCSTTLSGEQYICRYGQWAKLLLQSKYQESLKTMIPLVKNYPQWQTYYIIWLLYQEQGLMENAKAYFGKALRFVDERNKKPLASLMINLLNSDNDNVVATGSAIK